MLKTLFKSYTQLLKKKILHNLFLPTISTTGVRERRKGGEGEREEKNYRPVKCFFHNFTKLELKLF